LANFPGRRFWLNNRLQRLHGCSPRCTHQSPSPEVSPIQSLLLSSPQTGTFVCTTCTTTQSDPPSPTLENFQVPSMGLDDLLALHPLEPSRPSTT
jgi:hypothetical protein